MLTISDRDVPLTIRFFAELSLECGYLVPTENGLKKSIMDAHESLRFYFKTKSIHDFERQAQGQEHKVVVRANFVMPSELRSTTVSLYRPETKTGDPRLWISQLNSYAKARNLLAFLAVDGELFIINCSMDGLLQTVADPHSPLGGLVERMRLRARRPEVELLRRLRAVASRGFIQTLRAGPTGVGMTLETLLGISANSSKSPDFQGIELKATRTNRTGKAKTRSTLFSQAPDWPNSAIKNGIDLVRKHGINRNGRQQLNCTISNKPNTFKLFLSIEDSADVLHAKCGSIHDSSKVVQWPLPKLRGALGEKHKETFWIKALCQGQGAAEEFHYVTVWHSKSPFITNFSTLIETGFIEVDFVVHIKEELGKTPRIRDHGYLFKIDQGDFNLLFPPITIYSLI